MVVVVVLPFAFIGVLFIDPVPIVVPVLPAGLLVVPPVFMSDELPGVLIEPVGVVMPELELFVGLLMVEFDEVFVVDVVPLLEVDSVVRCPNAAAEASRQTAKIDFFIVFITF